MLASAVPSPVKYKFLRSCLQDLNTRDKVAAAATVRTKIKGPAIFFYSDDDRIHGPNSLSNRLVRTRVSSDGAGAVDATPQQSVVSDVEATKSTGFGDSYIALFVRMLGLDHDPLDREQAIMALHKYSLGGKKCIDAIMQFPGCINLTINLLRSESSYTCEAAAGLLRSISQVNLYRDSVAESGAIEEIRGLLSRPSLTAEVKKQSISTLWNLSVDDKLRVKIASAEILLLLIKYLDDEDVMVKEAAGGVLANLALSPFNHKIMVEAGIVPKLAKLLKSDAEVTKVLRKEAKSVLLELAKDVYYRILVIEEGVIPVPMIGPAAYKSFRPALHTWPTLPEGIEIEQSSKGPSPFGASELLLGLNIDEKTAKIEESKVNAIVGRSQQQFLARIGAMELEKKSQSESFTNNGFSLLPWRDGIARLVLILELEDESGLSKAADAIADASINEHIRVAFKESGAVKHLVRLLGCNNDSVRWAVLRALERLSMSNIVCQSIESEGAVVPLISTLKLSDIPETVMEKVLDILSRILDPGNEMKSKFYDGPVNGSNRRFDGVGVTDVPRGLATNSDEQPRPETSIRKAVLDSALIGRLVEILKTPSPNLQRKAASIFEFMAILDPSMEVIISADIESGLEAIFQQNALRESDAEDHQLETYALRVEEAGLAVSAASRLLTRLLDSQQFCRRISSAHFTNLIRQTLKSDIPLQNKDWVAACLVKLTSVCASGIDFMNPINLEVTLYETMPRLVLQIRTSDDMEAKEAAAVELNRLISEGIVNSSGEIASEDAVSSLVRLIEEGSERAVEAGLAILYNLSMDSENHPTILAAGAVPALRRIVLSHRPQWKRALHLLRTLPT